MRVQVPEYNTYVDFPDGIEQAEVERVLAQNFPPKKPKKSKVMEVVEGAIENLKDTPKTIKAMGETALGVASGAVAFPVSKARGLYELARTGGDAEAARAAEDRWSNAIQYTPDDPRAQQAVNVVGKVVEPVFGLAREASDLPLESWNAPESVRYAVNTAAEVAGPPIMGKILKPHIQAAKERIKPIVRQVLDETIRKKTAERVNQIPVEEPISINKPVTEMSFTENQPIGTPGMSPEFSPKAEIKEAPIARPGVFTDDLGIGENVKATKTDFDVSSTETSQPIKPQEVAPNVPKEKVQAETTVEVNPFPDSVVRDPVYHGSLDFIGDKFDVAKRGTNTKAGSANKAFWFSTEDVAKTYSEIIPDPMADVFDFLGDEFKNKETKHNPSIIPAHIALRNPLVYDFKREKYRRGKFNELVDKAIKNGNDGVIFKNVADNVGSGVDPIYSDVYGVFNPDQISIIKKGGPQNAIKEGKIKEGNIGEYSRTGELGTPAETGGGNRNVGGGEIKAEEVGAKRETVEPPPNIIPQVKGGMIGELPKYAEESSINLERLNTTNDVKQLLNASTERIAEKIGKRRVSWEETRNTAEGLGWDVQYLKRNWDSGKRMNAAQIEAARQINLNAISELNDAIRNLPYDQKELTPEVRAKFLDAMDAVRVTSQMSSEAGRALNIHKKVLSQDPSFKEKSAINKALKAIQGKGAKRTDAIIDKMREIDFTNPKEVNQFIYDVNKTKWQKFSDAAYELWINGLLSNPLTHIKNITSNAVTLAYTYPENVIAAGVEGISSRLTGRAKEIHMRENGSTIFSTYTGLSEGFRRSKDVLLKGEDVSKLDYRPSALPNKLRKWLPGQALMAEDAFFKGFIEHQHLGRLAFREAMKEGLKGDKLKERVADLLKSPTEEMIESAARRGEYLTYQKELGEIGNLVMKARNIVPGLKYFIPFVKTPTNIAKFALERTPLNFPRLIYKAMKGQLKDAALSEELAKPLLGSMVGYFVYQLADQGYITGGYPKKKAEREELQNVGWQAYSVKVGDSYYSYGYTEPMGSIVGIAADFAAIRQHMTEDEKYDVGSAIYSSIAKNIKDKTFMVGFSNLINATSDPEHYGSQMAKSLASSTVPAVIGGIARAEDDNIRDARTILDTVKSRIPGLSKTLPAKLTVWGDPIERQGSGVGRMLNPVQVSKSKGSPIEKEMVNLDLDISYPAKKITFRGKEIELTSEQYWNMVEMSGKAAKRAIESYMQSDNWNNLSKERKEDLISSTVRKARESARNRILVDVATKHPEQITKKRK